MSRCATCNCNMQKNLQNNLNQTINSSNISGCGFNDPPIFPNNYMYGQSYVPIQYISKTFKPESGLKMGTLFPELVSPYSPGQSMEEISYIASSSSGLNALMLNQNSNFITNSLALNQNMNIGGNM